ncbi:uncharacterized protein PFL1_04487 [Pseudozyma flocculosa PF-1]|uniref:Uncharacterized protein n=1 Tax=Pseudozyma flocculosa PF-1 TaxID=1277687 RepID=A0A061H814_9BASI|nr:uncharacterized protein PFL1_04487 [Pseudozyma flocculosa PF-1]EPQ28160.1 hypothetical protein PFL1_04487 [Pseudozyma flocculosa PF-1]
MAGQPTSQLARRVVEDVLVLVAARCPLSLVACPRSQVATPGRGGWRPIRSKQAGLCVTGVRAASQLHGGPIDLSPLRSGSPFVVPPHEPGSAACRPEVPLRKVFDDAGFGRLPACRPGPRRMTLLASRWRPTSPRSSVRCLCVRACVRACVCASMVRERRSLVVPTEHRTSGNATRAAARGVPGSIQEESASAAGRVFCSDMTGQRALTDVQYCTVGACSLASRLDREPERSRAVFPLYVSRYRLRVSCVAAGVGGPEKASMEIGGRGGPSSREQGRVGLPGRAAPSGAPLPFPGRTRRAWAIRRCRPFVVDVVVVERG